jgi:hypothetical protein
LLPEYFERGPASRDLSSLWISCCSQQSNRVLQNCAIRLCRCHGYRAGLDALLRAGVPRLCDGTTSAKCSVIFLRCFFPGAPPVRLSYRKQLAVSA